MKPTLLVLAAGMGSRYGGLKQMDAFGPNGETLLDYSIYDAVNAGFGKIVFVIRESFSEDFKAFFKGKFEDLVDIEYVFQKIEDVPNSVNYDPARKKPWGTAHAVWVARDVIKEPFVVINADDFYGRDAYIAIKQSLEQSTSKNYVLLGYYLQNTLSEHGTVNRGVCKTNESGQLISIEETLKIGFDPGGKIMYRADDQTEFLSPDTIVSMNFWGFYPDYFKFCEAEFKSFLESRGHEPKSEFFIPLLIEHLIISGKKGVDVVHCNEDWFGVTYQEDKPFVQERILRLISSGRYPEQLWK